MNIHEYHMTDYYRQDRLRDAEKMRYARQLQAENPSPSWLERFRRK